MATSKTRLVYSLLKTCRWRTTGRHRHDRIWKKGRWLFSYPRSIDFLFFPYLFGHLYAHSTGTCNDLFFASVPAHPWCTFSCIFVEFTAPDSSLLLINKMYWWRSTQMANTKLKWDMHGNCGARALQWLRNKKITVDSDQAAVTRYITASTCTIVAPYYSFTLMVQDV